MIYKRDSGKAVEQVNGCEREKATFLLPCLVKFGRRLLGFAPRHLNRFKSQESHSPKS